MQLPELMFALSIAFITLLAIYLSQLSPLRPPPPAPSRFIIPRSLSPPPDTSHTPYNEDTIVSLIIDLYQLLIKLGYFPSSSVIFPPPSGHSINLKLCEDLGISKEVVSLMQRIPYSTEGPERPLFQSARAYNYLDDQDIEQGRDPERGMTDEARRDYVLGGDLALTEEGYVGATWLVLDTKENTIRRVSDGVRAEDDKHERPEDPYHYRNCETENAVSFFRTYIERIKSLDILPRGEGYGGFLDSGDDLHYPIKKILVEEYGWPHEFRQYDWLRDMDGVWEKAEKEHKEWEKRATET